LNGKLIPEPQNVKRLKLFKDRSELLDSELCVMIEEKDIEKDTDVWNRNNKDNEEYIPDEVMWSKDIKTDNTTGKVVISTRDKSLTRKENGLEFWVTNQTWITTHQKKKILQ